MQNYNFTPENIDDINGQKSEFFSLVLEQTEDLVNLGILSHNDFETADKLFWTKFIQNHEEIRSDIKLTRHFIIKKKDKLIKELKTSLFMSNIYDKFMDDTKSQYWKFVHTVFLLLESCHKEKNDAIINTLTGELAKLIKLEVVEERVETSGQESSKSSMSGRLKNKKLNKKQDELDMSKINDLLGGMDMSKMGEMLGGMDMSKMGEMLGGMDMSKIGEMMKGIPGENGSEDMDMSKMLSTIMPGMETKKNDILMNDLIHDITSNMGNLESSDQVFEITKQLGEKYQKMIISGEIDSSEVIGSLMGLMTDKKFTEELSKIDMSKIKPEEMMSKMMENISPEMLGGLTNGNMDLTNIGSLITGITGMAGNTGMLGKTGEVKQELEQKELTEEQLKEMEEYYSKLSLEDAKLD